MNVAPASSGLDVAAFARDGFSVVTGLLSGSEIAQMRTALDEAMDRRAHAAGPRVDPASDYGRQFCQQYNLWEDCPRLRPLTMHRGIASTAATLLGVSRLRLLFDQALVKPPGATRTPRHQDQTRLPINGGIITAWIPLDPVDLANGSIGYVPGTHRIRPSSFFDLALGKTWTDEEQRLLENEPVIVEAEPGTISFHHGCIMHFAGENTTSLPRRVFTIVYASDGSQRNSSWPSVVLDRDRIEVGSPLHGPSTPLVWPAPSTALALPPPISEPSAGWPR